MLEPQLYFNGECSEAIELYKKTFKAETDSIMYDSEKEPEQFIIHAEMHILGTRLMLSDFGGASRSSVDSTMEIVAVFDNEEVLREAYQVINDGSTIITPIGPVFYSECLVSLLISSAFDGVSWYKHRNSYREVIMDKRLTFNEDVENYDKWRPTYCEELFKDICAYSQIGQGNKAIEVGIGTGQATKPFLDTGCDLTAIELGKNLAEYSRLKFRDYQNLKVFNTAFEQFECPDDSVDLIYSATAFHWIPIEIGYSKARHLLKTGGTLALFWNRPYAARENDDLHQQIQGIYQKYRPSNTKPIENDTERYNNITKNIQAYGFRDVVLKLYHSTRRFSSADYISLLNTYSDHRSMPPTTKALLEDEIKEAILQSGDVLNVYDTVDLYLARK
jgi:uncharacterized glyoxalase superfamily protein PhnB/SAM-dependent methyltransferase